MKSCACLNKKGELRYCKLMGFKIETDNAEINICGNCVSYQKQKFIKNLNYETLALDIEKIYTRLLDKDKITIEDIKCKSI